MSGQENGNKPNSASNALDRRKMLLAGTTLAAASALGHGRRRSRGESRKRSKWRRYPASQTLSSSWVTTLAGSM